MRIIRSTPFSVSGIALSVALAVGVAFAAGDVGAQSRGGKPGAGISGGKPAFDGGGRGGWQGGRPGGWEGGRHDGWRGSGQGRYWNGGYAGYGRPWNSGYGQHRYGWHGGRYYYPGWALGLGVGIGLSYPWWGYPYAYSYPSSYVVYERAYDAPVGVVVDRDGPIASPAPAYRWYCPAPAGFHPDVRECSAGWLKVLPHEGGPASSPPSVPRSSAPLDDAPVSRIAPGTMGSMSSPVRIAAPSMTPPSQVARDYAVSRESLAQSATQ